VKTKAIAVAIALSFVVSATARAQQVDTAGWVFHSVPDWGLSFMAPPDWVEVNLRMADIRATIRRDLSGGQTVVCHIHVTLEPWNTAITQQEINAQMTAEAMPSPQRFEAVLQQAGQQMHVLDTGLVAWMNFPAFIYEATASEHSFDYQMQGKLIGVMLRTPGRLNGIDCDGNASTQAGAAALYAQWLPTFRAIMARTHETPRFDG
jgi:hypothetical protein